MLHEHLDYFTVYVEVLFVNAWLIFFIYLVFLYHYIDTNMYYYISNAIYRKWYFINLQLIVTGIGYEKNSGV